MHSDRCGRTPVRVALKSGHSAISKILEEVALARSKTCKFLFWKYFRITYNIIC